MTSVTFPPNVGGDGSTVTDDNNPSTGLGNGGHRTRFVPALAQIVAVAQFVVNAATAQSNAVFTPCRLMTTTNDTLSGLAARDGITPIAGDRVFVGAQTAGAQNGPYIAAAGAWQRAPDGNLSTQFRSSKIIAVSEGAIGGGTVWYISNTGVITLGSTSLTFAQLPNLTKANIWAAAQTFNAALTIAAALGMSGAAINEAQGANIASAATINLDAATGNLVDVTGTTSITAITLAAGRERTTRFNGALTLTNGANLILPGAANIGTANGDVAIWRGFPSGVVQCVSYTRAASLPVLAYGGTMTGPLGMSGAPVNTAQGSDIASSSTIDLDAATGNVVNISGTSSISAVTLTNGRERFARATGAFRLVHGASLVVLPNSASRTVVAGDLIRFSALNGVTYAQIYPSQTTPIAVGLQNSTSGTNLNFTGIPDWAKRITILFGEVSTNGTNHLLVQLGDSGGVEGSGYVSNSAQSGGSGNTTNGTGSSQGFVIWKPPAIYDCTGSMTITKISGNTWVASHALGATNSNGSIQISGGGVKTLSDVLTQIRFITDGGTDTLDKGIVNVFYE